MDAATPLAGTELARHHVPGIFFACVVRFRACDPNAALQENPAHEFSTAFLPLASPPLARP